MQLDDHFFRRESARMIAALTRSFGLTHLQLVEDAVQDTFCRALDAWSLRGYPDAPSAWLMVAAKRRAIDLLRRDRSAHALLARLACDDDREGREDPPERCLDGYRDEMLRMMFTCCHDDLSSETQVALVLHLVCGFSADEIAAAFMKRAEAVAKRLQRAKHTLAAAHDLFDIDAPERFASRLPSVQRATYLLFNQGYHGTSVVSPVRAELCAEAMRLQAALLADPRGATSDSFALAALMCFLRARLDARIDDDGNLLVLEEQDRSRWDRALIDEGAQLLVAAAEGHAGPYHLEASIAFVHASASEASQTAWATIVALYDRLFVLRPSPIVALNRAIAVGRAHGASAGLEALRAIDAADRLRAYPFYEAAFGEFACALGDRNEAARRFSAALALARTPTESRFFERRLARVADASC